MTSQEKKKELRKYRSLVRQCDALIDERNRWMEIATRITPAYSDLPKSPGTDKVQTAAASIADLDARIEQEIREINAQRERIVEAIRSVEDVRYRELLKYRYIDGLTFEEIAVKMHYTYQWICAMHGGALESIRLDSN